MKRLPLKRKPRRRSAEEKAASEAWHASVMLAGEHPVIGGPTEFRLAALFDVQAHHPIPRSICRRHGAPEWDARNGAR